MTHKSRDYESYYPDASVLSVEQLPAEHWKAGRHVRDFEGGNALEPYGVSFDGGVMHRVKL